MIAQRHGKNLLHIMLLMESSPAYTAFQVVIQDYGIRAVSPFPAGRSAVAAGFAEISGAESGCGFSFFRRPGVADSRTRRSPGPARRSGPRPAPPHPGR
jgi:hypothetical protein